MILWLVFGLMTAAAIFAVLWPLGRARRQRGGSDLAVYRDQLDEIGRDRAAGLIGEAEAEAARVEVSRRLIAAADTQVLPDPVTASARDLRRRTAGMAALIALPIVAAATYLTLGSPELPGQPLASRDATPIAGPHARPARRAGRDRILRKIPRMAAAGRSSARSTCGSAASTMP